MMSIAAALSNICRFGGHCPDYYSVAEHSVHAAEMARDDEPCNLELQKAVLLHDAAEAYVGDVVKPLKQMLPDYTVIESRVEAAIEQRFGIDMNAYADQVKMYDRLALKAEKIAMWPTDRIKWEGFADLPVRNIVFGYWPPRRAFLKFLRMCRQVGIRD